MSFRKAIKFKKEKRYDKALSKCRCDLCSSDRTHSSVKKELSAKEQISEFTKDEN